MFIQGAKATEEWTNQKKHGADIEQRQPHRYEGLVQSRGPDRRHDEGQQTPGRYVIDRRTGEGHRADLGLQQVALNQDTREYGERRNGHGGPQK